VRPVHPCGVNCVAVWFEKAEEEKNKEKESVCFHFSSFWVFPYSLKNTTTLNYHYPKKVCSVSTLPHLLAGKKQYYQSRDRSQRL
jgi:hypothetical protein